MCLCGKTYCCNETTPNKLKLSSNRLNKRILEQGVDDPLENYRKVLDERMNITSTEMSRQRITQLQLMMKLNEEYCTFILKTE